MADLFQRLVDAQAEREIRDREDAVAAGARLVENDPGTPAGTGRALLEGLRVLARATEHGPAGVTLGVVEGPYRAQFRRLVPPGLFRYLDKAPERIRVAYDKRLPRDDLGFYDWEELSDPSLFGQIRLGPKGRTPDTATHEGLHAANDIRRYHATGEQQRSWDRGYIPAPREALLERAMRHPFIPGFRARYDDQHAAKLEAINEWMAINALKKQHPWRYSDRAYRAAERWDNLRYAVEERLDNAILGTIDRLGLSGVFDRLGSALANLGRPREIPLPPGQ